MISALQLVFEGQPVRRDGFVYDRVLRPAEFEAGLLDPPAEVGVASAAQGGVFVKPDAGVKNAAVSQPVVRDDRDPVRPAPCLTLNGFPVFRYLAGGDPPENQFFQ